VFPSDHPRTVDARITRDAIAGAGAEHPDPG
jgi:hypothetical protein